MNTVKSVFGIQDAPGAPDLTTAAKQTATSNFYAANPNKSNAFQSLQYTQNPDGSWSQKTTLNGAGQGMYDRAESAYSQPFDYSSVGDVEDAAYKSQTDRLDPQWTQSQQALETQLANQGIQVGSDAYAKALREFNVGKNDAYSGARMNAAQLAPQTLQMAQSVRNQPMQELSNWQNLGQFQNSTGVGGVDYFGAANGNYQNEVGRTNANNAFGSNVMNGLFNLGSSYAMGLGKSAGTPKAGAN